jgi:hypothetical protein
MLRTSLRSLPVAAFLVLLCARPTWADADDDNLRGDVLRCEDAVAYLKSCCPGFDASKLQCDYLYDSTGCDSPVHRIDPVFSREQSACIVGLSCGALVGNGVCARAQAATSYDCWSSPADSGVSCNSTPTPAVCP